MLMNNEINIIWISNIVFEPYLSSNVSLLFGNISEKVSLTYLSCDECIEDLELVRQATYICVCVNFDELYPNIINDISSKKLSLEDIEMDIINKCKFLHRKLKDNTCVPIIWFSFEDYFNKLVCVHGAKPMVEGIVDKINRRLLSIIDNNNVIDMKRLIAEIGISNSYDYKGKYRWNAPYSKPLVERIANEIYKQYLIYSGHTKKCIIVDCDNVLWGGILSEDGIEKIQLGHSGWGRSFQDFQRFLLSLYYCGVILVICSKNDEEDVLKVFREHSGMLLREEHVACFAINWDNKPENIIKIASDLNIDLNSIVFVDDSEIEVQAVKKMLPEITGFLYQPNTPLYESFCFNIKNEVDLRSITNRIQTYKTNKNRNILRGECDSYQDYLNQLCICVDIHRSIPNEYARIVELTLRTNKCTNGRRYSLDSLRVKLEEDKYLLFTVVASDIFSNLGIVGVIGIQENYLDLFALSCRALGRNIEKKMIAFVKQMDVKEYYFERTGKNESLHLLMEL